MCGVGRGCCGGSRIVVGWVKVVVEIGKICWVEVVVGVDKNCCGVVRGGLGLLWKWVRIVVGWVSVVEVCWGNCGVCHVLL